MPINPIKDVQSLRDRAYEEIKREILKLGLEPGQFLSIGDLAKQLSVSRTPVRDALLQLEREGWVTVLPFKGAYVSVISVKDIEDIFELLVVLEAHMARLAAEKFTDSDVEKADTLLAQSQSLINTGRMSETAGVWSQFHNLIEAAANNPRMLEIIDQLRQQCIRLRHFTAVVPERVSLSYDQHRAILEAIRARDPERAEALMRTHQISVRDSLLETARAITMRSVHAGAVEDLRKMGEPVA